MTAELEESSARLDKVAAEVNELWRRHWERLASPQLEYEDAGKILGEQIAMQQEQERARRASTERWRQAERDRSRALGLQYN